MNVVRQYVRALLEIKRARYVGIAIEKESRNMLRRMISPIHPVLHANHVTLVLDPTPEQLLQAREGARVPMRVVGHAVDSKAQAVAVEMPKHLYMDERTPHITISTAEGVEPSYSNSIISKAKPTTSLVLWGTVRLYE
jgi:hypothetical protein